MDHQFDPNRNYHSNENQTPNETRSSSGEAGNDTASHGEYHTGYGTEAESTPSQAGMKQENAGNPGSLYSYSYVNKEERNRQYYTPYEEPQNRRRRRKKEPGEKKPGEKKTHGFGVILGKCAAIALVFGLVSGTVFYGTGYIFEYASGKKNQPVQQNTMLREDSDSSKKMTNTSTQTQAVVSDVSQVVENVMPSIVSITNLTTREIDMPYWFGGSSYSQEIPSAGSGIIVAQTDTDLYIATNNHVVVDASTLTVTFRDNESVTAEIKGTDPNTDLAVISVPISSIPGDTLSKIKVATLGNSSDLQVGEPAIAIGNALGYGQSVTTGVISALEREVTVTDQNGNVITNSLIQTDAAINPGNSGGALLNIKGEVIGINSVKYSDTKVEGMGYSIPISKAEPIINDLIVRQAVDESESSYLGIFGVDVSTEVNENYNMPKGLYVTQVANGSAAEEAGIRPGDIITAFDGYEISSQEQLAERMRYYAAGTTVDITVKSAEGGEYVERIVTATLGKKIQ